MTDATESFQPRFYAHLDFNRALDRGRRERDRCRARSRRDHLLTFDDVCDAIGGCMLGPRQLREIPLDAIVGSVGRAEDFSPGFLPLRAHDEDRWIAIERVINGLGGLPPIDTYELDGRHYVLNGHLRVAVYRWLGLTWTEAYVRHVSHTADVALA